MSNWQMFPRLEGFIKRPAEQKKINIHQGPSLWPFSISEHWWQSED